ncbi:MAG: glycosyltransferase family 4 protein, partial [Nitrospira sp.]
LLIAGPSPPSSELDELRLHELTSFERSRVIHICDFKDSDKASIFDALDVFVLPSVGESFGIAYLEAWVCGKPVIGADIGPTRDVIQNGVDGLLAKPDDPNDVAEKIVELLLDQRKREQMGQNGRAKTLARYTWDRIIDRMENIYCAVAGRSCSS